MYGVVQTFARDILRTEFQFQNVRKNRECEVVIVDEVDSMLIDHGCAVHISQSRCWKQCIATYGTNLGTNLDEC